MLFLVTILQGCKGQTQSKNKELFNKDFNWTIAIPENFNAVSPQELANLQQKGTAAIEKTYDGTVENNAEPIFVFRSDQFNYFESNYQPFDSSKDPDYVKSFRNVNNILYNTFKAQMPDAKLDSSSSTTVISGLTFQTFHVSITFPNKMVMTWLMYSRLFDKNEFTVNIMTTDKQKEKELLNCWLSSKFDH